MALGIEYDGADFAGWETQVRQRTVQSCVESALSRVADHPVKVVCAGRTDSGVHAFGQVVHFDTPAQRSARSWVLGSNVYLPPDAGVCWAREVAPEFHARFSARGRRYRYLIHNGLARPVLARRRITWERRPLETGRMREAGQFLVGEHDFSTFRSLDCQARHARRRIFRLDVWRTGDRVVIDVEANAFLHHMVRNIAGVLMAVGFGQREPGWVLDLLDWRDRRRGGVTAPADGLYLLAVEYPSHFRIPRLSPAAGLW